MQRNDGLHAFVDAASTSFGACAVDAPSRRSVRQVFAALASPAPRGSPDAQRLPACGWLDAALAARMPQLALNHLIDTFRHIEPMLHWRRRTSNETASDNFEDGHANAMILGPGGLEERRDAWLGVSLLAPHVRYPDHDHAPEEVYLVLSEGEFRQGEGGWFSPGIGGSFYNEPGIRHAMRSLEAPLLAFWILQPDGELR